MRDGVRRALRLVPHPIRTVPVMEAMVFEFPAERRHDIVDGEPAGRQPACAGHDERLWFEPALFEQGRAYCDRCPIREQCLTQALLAGERHGLWGGMSPDERQRLPRAPVVALPLGRRVARSR